MEHESFEDAEVARLMNETFINIKVDREERPDLDSVYMTICQMMTGSGGWPLTILMTPDKRPFFAGTYFPKESRFGRIGMLDLIPRVHELWRSKQQDVLQSAEKAVEALQRVEAQAPGEALDLSIIAQAYKELSESFDEENGGFGGAPKFPTPHKLTFLLRYYARTGDERGLQMTNKTLQAMRLGGIFDQIGFGFHRYSTDAHWLLPHFEKMLYDQALLAIAYTEAYQATLNHEYKQTAREVLDYVLRDLTSPEGGFYSAEDADSEGEEGRFYLWSEEEIRKLLHPDQADLISKVFGISPDGNFLDEATHQKSGSNILHLKADWADVASELDLPEDALRRELEHARQKLFESREMRIHPHKDDKILTDWNGLVIAALAKAASAFAEPRYAIAAERAMSLILKTLQTPDAKLLHRFRDGEAAIPGFLDDYAFLIWGLLELYEATFQVGQLETAIRLNEILLENFWDDDSGGFFVSSKQHEELLVRKKEIYDGAVPSGNSVAMLNLIRLGRITSNSEFEERAARIGRAFSLMISRYASAHTQLLTALDFALGPSLEVVIVGEPEARDTRAMLQAIHNQFIPNKIVLFVPSRQPNEMASIATFIKNFKSANEKATAYVCQNYACQMPTTDPAQMLAQIHSLKDRT